MLKTKDYNQKYLMMKNKSKTELIYKYLYLTNKDIYNNERIPFLLI